MQQNIVPLKVHRAGVAKKAVASNAIYSRVHLADQFAKADNMPNPMSGAEPARFPDQVRPLVNVHPMTGRKALLVSIEQCRELEGMDQDTSRRCNEKLLDVITAPERVYRHRWQARDLVVWDNRCMLHSPTPYTYSHQRRRLHRINGLESGGDMIPMTDTFEINHGVHRALSSKRHTDENIS